MNKQKTHIGVYAIIENKGRIVLIRKARGPYKGMYDLPGGGIEPGESLSVALARELNEEIGCTPTQSIFLDTLKDSFEYLSSDGTRKTFVHTGHYFSVQIDSSLGVKTEADGYDSLGAEWFSLDEIDSGNILIPPIVQRALKFYREQ